MRLMPQKAKLPHLFNFSIQQGGCKGRYAGKRLPRRQNLQPIAVRVLDEVDAHLLVLVAHPSPLPVEGPHRLEVIGLEGQMELLLPQIVAGNLTLSSGVRDPDLDFPCDV